MILYSDVQGVSQSLINMFLSCLSLFIIRRFHIQQQYARFYVHYWWECITSEENLIKVVTLLNFSCGKLRLELHELTQPPNHEQSCTDVIEKTELKESMKFITRSNSIRHLSSFSSIKFFEISTFCSDTDSPISIQSKSLRNMFLSFMILYSNVLMVSQTLTNVFLWLGGFTFTNECFFLVFLCMIRRFFRIQNPPTMC